MCCAPGFVNIIFKVSKVFLVAFLKRASSLADVFHVTIGADELVDSTEVVLILTLGAFRFMRKEFTNGVVGGICYSYRRLFEQFRDKLSLFTYVRKFSPWAFVLTGFIPPPPRWCFLILFYQWGRIPIVLQYALDGMLFNPFIVIT
jgi:hypothetical protein